MLTRTNAKRAAIRPVGRLFCSMALGVAILLGGPAAAGDFPVKPIVVVVPFSPGSATDLVARAIAQGVSQQTGQSVVVENRPGASAMIGATYVARAAPDGYTVLVTTNTTHAANEHLYKQLPYDPVKDYAPIALLGKGAQVMMVNPDSPARTVQEFLELAKHAQGKLTFGAGSDNPRIAGELLQQMAGVELLYVPYKGNPLAISDLLGGHIDTIISDITTGLPQIKSGRLRALAVTSIKRDSLLPDVPTLDESGLPGYEMGYWFAAYAPAGTPPRIVDRLNALFVEASRMPAARQFYEATGTDSQTSTPAELAAFQKSESRKWAEVIERAKIKPE